MFQELVMRGLVVVVQKRKISAKYDSAAEKFKKKNMSHVNYVCAQEKLARVVASMSGQL